MNLAFKIASESMLIQKQVIVIAYVQTKGDGNGQYGQCIQQVAQ